MSYLCNVERGQKTQVLTAEDLGLKTKAPKPPKGECKEEGK